MKRVLCNNCIELVGFVANSVLEDAVFALPGITKFYSIHQNHKFGKLIIRARKQSVRFTAENLLVKYDEVEIRVDTTVATATKQSANRPDIVIHDKKRKEIILIEVGVTSQDQLQIVESEKKRKYDSC